MILKSIRVMNFRSIKDETLNCDDLTALVGANGSGKSSFLHAIELFQNNSAKVYEEDYYNRNTADDIIIAITFKDLSTSAHRLFARYIQNNELTVERVFKWSNGNSAKAFHGSMLQNPDFKGVLENNATNAKQEYEKILENYTGFPQWSSHEKIKNLLRKWENDNPNKCERSRDDGKFFGFDQVGEGYLGKFVKFLCIPAVHDASKDVLENKGSIMKELMDLVIRKNLAESEEIKKFQKDIKQRHTKVIDTSKLKLKDLGESLTATLQNFAPDTEIDLAWKPLENLGNLLPETMTYLVEDGYRSTVERTGHGLQRSFIMTTLQHLSAAQVDNSKRSQQHYDEFPTLVFMIEEPELYQHPNRQRHLAKLFLSLAKRGMPGVSGKMQIIYSTHSPHFVDIERINQIRLLRKMAAGTGKPKITKIFSTNLQEVASELSQVSGKSILPDDALQSRLHIMTQCVNEGFFSDVAVLVEGEEDRAIITSIAKSLGHEFESMGISVIPCLGINNLYKPTIIFRNLGIPIYVIWDGDKGKNTTKRNNALLSLMRQSISDCPKTCDTFACFENDIQDILKREIGEELFETLMNKYNEDFAINKTDHVKNPFVLSKIIEQATKDGHSCKTLKLVVKKIINLRE